MKKQTGTVRFVGFWQRSGLWLRMVEGKDAGRGGRMNLIIMQDRKIKGRKQGTSKVESRRRKVGEKEENIRKKK